jgi:hypothetical protein
MSAGDPEEKDRALDDHAKPVGRRQRTVVGMVEIALDRVVPARVQLEKPREHPLMIPYS